MAAGLKTLRKPPKNDLLDLLVIKCCCGECVLMWCVDIGEPRFFVVVMERLHWVWVVVGLVAGLRLEPLIDVRCLGLWNIVFGIGFCNGDGKDNKMGGGWG